MKIFRHILVLVLMLFPAVAIFAQDIDSKPLYQRFFVWPNFCKDHLLTDPEGCSAWYFFIEGPILQEERNNEPDDWRWVRTYAYIDPSLIGRVSKYLYLIPEIEGDTCDYGICTKCNQRLLREDFWIEGCKRRIEIEYKCDCLNHSISFHSPSYPHYNSVTKNWKFCKAPAIYSGYFEKYRSTFFNHFEEYLSYCHDNRCCKCFWPECSSQMRDILNEIVLTFFDELKKYLINDSAIHEYILDHYYGLDPTPTDTLVDHLSHSFFYSQIRESLLKLHSNLACWALGQDKGELSEKELANLHFDFCEALFKKLRPMYLELYQACYAKHPHSKIAKEIKLVEAEIELRD